MFSQASVILFTEVGSCMAGDGRCMAGGMHGGGGMCGGGGGAWQERRPLQRMVRILLECIIVRTVKFNEMFALIEQI